MGLNDYIRGDRFEFLGRFRIDEYLIEKDKYIKGKWNKNLITDKWKEGMAGAVCGLGKSNKYTIKYLGVSTDNTAPNAENTTLKNQLGDLKEYLTEALTNFETPNIANGLWFYDSPEAQYYGEWKKLGLFAQDGITMLTESLIDPTVTFNSGKTINVIYEVIF